MRWFAVLAREFVRVFFVVLLATVAGISIGLAVVWALYLGSRGF